MTSGKKWLYLIGGAVGALAIAGAALFVFTQKAAAQVETGQPAARGADSGWMQNSDDKDGPGKPDDHEGPFGDMDELLADALGISVEDLQAARQTAFENAVQQAVDQGVITQEEADTILEEGHVGRGENFLRDAEIDMQALLADALGISVEELQAAQEAAFDAALQQAVDEGTITEEQAELIKARKAVQSYVQEAMSNAYAEALENAVSDGVITQEQADQLLENPMSGTDFSGRPDGHHGGKGHSGPGNQPSTDDE